MATVTHEVGTADTDATPNTSGAFTPAVGDLLVVFVTATGTLQATATLTSSVGGFTFTQVTNQQRGTPSHSSYMFVSDALVSSATSQTVTFDTASDGATGTVIQVAAIAGVTRVGLDAIRQFKSTTNIASVTPAVTFDAACLTGNPTLCHVANTDNPAGMTEPTGWTEASDLGHATPDNGGEYAFRNSGFTGTTITWGSDSASAWGAIIAEVDTSSAGPTVTDVDTDESITGTQTNVVITGAGFEAARGTGTVALVDQDDTLTQEVSNYDSWADTSIQVDVTIGTSTGVRYGAGKVRVTNNSAASGELAVTITAPSGKNYVDLTTLADPADRLTTDPDMEAGDQLEWSNVVGTGMTIADVTVYPDGSFSFTDGVESFDFRVHDVTTGWGAIATVTTEGLVPTITTTTLQNGTDGVVYSVAIVVTGDAPITFSLLSGSLPNGLALSTAGEIDGIPTLSGVYSFTVRATNSFGTDDQALSITVAEAGVTGALASPRKVVSPSLT